MRVYLARRDGVVLETTAPLSAVVAMLRTEAWIALQVRTVPRQKYHMVVMNSGDVECAWERGVALPIPWQSIFASEDGAK